MITVHPQDTELQNQDVLDLEKFLHEIRGSETLEDNYTVSPLVVIFYKLHEHNLSDNIESLESTKHKSRFHCLIVYCI